MKKLNGCPIKDTLTPSMLRTLGAVLSGQRSMNGLARALACNINHARMSLRCLRRRGVVAFEDDLGGTLRPTVRFIPGEEL